MAKLNIDDFDRFFEALWSKPGEPRPPFAWQHALAERVLAQADNKPWPQAIALPTAAGKTACIDIALFALAAQADRLDRGAQVTAPRRIFFVVDRRVIVDEAFERARKIAKALERPNSPILEAVRDKLLRIADAPHAQATDALPKQPLGVHVLRGGMYRSEAWARDPLQPAVIASTVDQIGSRMLFRGYGRGSGMWPVLAGLTANDSLILLDEAHCAQPFLQTLQSVQRYRGWAEQGLARAFHPVILSATPPEGVSDRFDDQSDQRADPNHPLGRRQRASKPARLEVETAAKKAKANDKLAKRLVDEATGLANGEARAVVIFTNRVATARAAHAILSKRGDCDSAILTGRMRAADKQSVIENELGSLSSDQADKRRLQRPCFVVATQTLEVGADLDFDALVTECASLDALRQRFGRLNRMGRPIDSNAVIVIRADQEKKSDDDPVYGAALSNTWNWLKEQANENNQVDLGILALEQRLPDHETLSTLSAPSPNAPIMLPAHLDAFVQTSPCPVPEPEISLFLHGPRDFAADVQLVFRADIDPASLDTSQASLSLCPPSSSESLAVPIGSFRRWFNGRSDEDDSSDVEGASVSQPAKQDDAPSQTRALRWKGSQGVDLIESADTIKPGDVLVLPAEKGIQEGLGDFPPQVLPPHKGLDIGDEAHRIARAKNILRLHPRLVESWPECPEREQAKALLDKLGQRYEEDPNGIAEEVRSLLDALGKHDDIPGWNWLFDAARGLSEELRGRKLRAALNLIGDRELIIVGKRPVPTLIPSADLFSDEDDSSSSGTARRNGKPVYLRDHLPGVASFARRFALALGLSTELTDVMEKAGLFHDLGKTDPRFQKLLRGGLGLVIGEPLAKSAQMARTPEARATARAASGYPQGARHELLSVRMAEASPDLLPDDNLLRDLLLHLIESHHGYCRPFAPVVFDDSTDSISFSLDGHTFGATLPTRLERLDSGVPDRFWRLVRAYGWWGLAWLEAVLRLADHRRSEWEERND